MEEYENAVGRPRPCSSSRRHSRQAVLLLLLVSPPGGRAPAASRAAAGWPRPCCFARAAVTCLVLTDAAMATLVSDAGDELGAIKNALRLHSLLDYWDLKKLRALPDGDTLTDTFYQAMGNAASDHVGSVKMAKLEGGGFGFAAAASPGDTYAATVTKALKQTQYDFAVLEISAPMEFDDLFDVPS